MLFVYSVFWYQWIHHSWSFWGDKSVPVCSIDKEMEELDGSDLIGLILNPIREMLASAENRLMPYTFYI